MPRLPSPALESRCIYIYSHPLLFSTICKNHGKYIKTSNYLMAARTDDTMINRHLYIIIWNSYGSNPYSKLYTVRAQNVRSVVFNYQTGQCNSTLTKILTKCIITRTNENKKLKLG